jgi:hypothetical protein
MGKLFSMALGIAEDLPKTVKTSKMRARRKGHRYAMPFD